MLASMAILWTLDIPGSLWLIMRQGVPVPQAWLWGAVSYTVLALALWGRFRSDAWQKADIFADRST